MSHLASPGPSLSQDACLVRDKTASPRVHDPHPQFPNMRENGVRSLSVSCRSGAVAYLRRLVFAGSGKSQALQLPRPLCSTRSASMSQDCAISNMLAFNPGSESCCATARQSAAF
jgi:hypothetical protein